LRSLTADAAVIGVTISTVASEQLLAVDAGRGRENVLEHFPLARKHSDVMPSLVPGIHVLATK
jgi:hypothetical protein